MEQLQISVTAADIAKGKPRDVRWCPIARAVRRLGKKKSVEVCNDIKLGSARYSITDKASDFIDGFDEGVKVKPFSFVAKKETF